MKLPGLLFSIILAFPLGAQEVGEWISRADRSMTAGAYQEAGVEYERAGRLKPDRPGLLYKAAEAYYLARNYAKAADCYRSLRHQEEYPLAGLRYARTLKQSGKYPEAQVAFREFLSNYKGEQPALMQEVVSKDLAGCALALRLYNDTLEHPLTLAAQALPKPGPNAGNAFAPFPFGPDALYFSAVANGRAPAQFWRIERADKRWLAPVEAAGLPPEAARNFASGSFSPDGSRFYCVQCDAQTGAKNTAGEPLCKLLVMRRRDDGWWPPEPLRDYINWPGSTTLAPALALKDGQELLFFASDRPGGAGGLDLYVCERPLAADDLDFSLPRNLGPLVNSGGDDTTPWFDTSSNTLFFSSNGQVSLGGFDVYRTSRNGQDWSAPENLGLPFNSPADDRWFVPNTENGGGFLSSNRANGLENNPFDDDIFEIVPAFTRLFLVGEVTDEQQGQLLTGCLIALYELSPDGEVRLAQIQASADGRFRFRLSPGSSYAVEATKNGFQAARATLGLLNQTPEGYAVGLLMRRNPPSPSGETQPGKGERE